MAVSLSVRGSGEWSVDAANTVTVHAQTRTDPTVIPIVALLRREPQRVFTAAGSHIQGPCFNVETLLEHSVLTPEFSNC